MSTYLGYDVLDLVEHNRRESFEERVRWRFTLLDTATGKRTADAHDRASSPVRPFLWTAFSRTEAKAIRDFLDARRGRAVPFWLPSYQKDLTLAVDGVATGIILTVDHVRYAQLLFGDVGARRHVALHLPGGAFAFHKVTAATDPGNGLTETLTVSPALAVAYPKATTLVCFLKFCRLDEDEVELTWLSRDHADAVIHCRELPNEAPT